MPPELIQTAARILDAEARDGFLNRVVIGGLSGFLTRLEGAGLGDGVEQAIALLRGYEVLDPAARAERLSRARRLLLEPAPAAAPARLTAAPAAPRPRTASSPPPAGITLQTPISSLKGVGPVRARLFGRLGLTAVEDLLYHFPARHVHHPPATPIAQLFFQSEGSVVGTLERLEVENLPRGLKKLRAIVADDSGTVSAVWLRHGTARIGLQPGEQVALSGRLVQQGRALVLDAPDYERADGPAVHTRRMVPVHPLTAGLTERELRGRIHWALTHFASRTTDPLPPDVLARHALLPLQDALWAMHFPASADEFAAARRRFAFEELLMIQLLVLRRRMAWQQEQAPVLPRHSAALAALAGALPFELTAAQQRVTDEILRDMASSQPMTRLLQGEVGSGKTAVAAMALLNAVANGYQAAIMAPTAILAEQHFLTLSMLFDSAGEALERVLGHAPSHRLLTSAIKGKQRAAAYAEVAEGRLDVLVGTQALIQEGLEFARLGLVVVDEQHRFGVRQRVTLRRRTADGIGSMPHLLVMTATPIPRTLALSMYGDLDLSTIDQMPPGRQAVKTVLLGPDEREFAYQRIRRATASGQQAFIICPLVEESETLEVRAATEEYERLRTAVFDDLKLALLHGRMKPAEKEATMRAFRDREFDVLVSTAVVEVGVDIPNATVMLVEGAERFGLAQLHQFRGRVGRGEQPAVCILLTDQPDPEANERLRAVRDTTSGLALAEQDLRLRGPGDFFGVRQSGMPELKVARLDDAPLIESARSTAADVLGSDPDLLMPEHAALRAHLLEFAARAGEPS